MGQLQASAFVIQFEPGADPERGCCAGRVEHVASTRATRFASLSELVGFMSAALREAGARAALESPPAGTASGNR